MTYQFRPGDRVLARINGSDYYPATIVDPKGWWFVSTQCYAVEFDQRPVTSSGTLNARRVTVLKGNVAPFIEARV